MKQALLNVFAALVGAYLGALYSVHVANWVMQSVHFLRDGVSMHWSYATSPMDLWAFVLGIVGGAFAGVYLVNSFGE